VTTRNVHVNVNAARTTIRNRVLPTVAAVVFLPAVTNPAGTANADDDLPRGKFENKNGVAMANISPPNSADHVYRFRPC
jgi:hypothetical protein